MRIPAPALVKLAFVAALALAAPAASQQPDRAGLKGPQSGAKPTPAEQPATPPPTLPAPMSPIPAGPVLTPVQSADQCRTSCARAYYFCLSSDTPDDCPNAWSQCRRSCNGGLSGS